MSWITREDFIKGAIGATAIGLNCMLPENKIIREVVAQDAPIANRGGNEVILTDAIVLTMDSGRRAFRSGFVWIKGNHIYRVGSSVDLGSIPDGISQRSLGGRLIMPGLVNCHTHSSNGILRGIYDEMPLEVWFSQGMWPVISALDGPTAEAAADLALLELTSTGVTTVASGEFGTPNGDVPDGVLTSLERAGIRAVLSRITFDSADESAPAQFIPAPYREKPAVAADEVRRLQRRFNSSRISVGPEALGVLRCSKDMVLTMYDLAVETDSLFTMHASSSQDERDESQRRFGHGSIVELERLGVLGPKTLLAHAIWVSDEEIQILADRQTGISHNPVSNAYYAAGVARLPEMLDAGIRVGLGTDGASTNNSQNVWETMKMAILFQKQRLEQANFGSAELALELMTRGGAAALHMEDEIGSLEPGKRADLIVIDVERVSLSPVQTVISNLVYSNDPWAVQDVFVDGELVVSDGVHRTLDPAIIIPQAQQAADRLLRRTDLDRHLIQRSGWKWE